MSHTIVLLEKLPQPLLTVRTHIRREDTGRGVEEGLAEIRGYLTGITREPTGPPCARFRWTGPGELDLDVGLPVAMGVTGSGRIRTSALPSGTVAVTQHFGPLSRLREAYDAVEEWFAQAHVESRGAPWEIYWSEPSIEADPLEWRTELVWPVQRRVLLHPSPITPRGARPLAVQIPD